MRTSITYYSDSSHSHTSTARMLEILELLAVPALKLRAIFTLLFLTVPSLIRHTLTISSRKATHLTLPHHPVHHYPPLQLDPPPRPTCTRYQDFYSAGRPSSWTGPQPEFRDIRGFVLILVLGSLVVLLSLLASLIDLCCRRRKTDEPGATHVAGVYKTVTGRSYHISSHWEHILSPPPSPQTPSPHAIDSDVNLDLRPELSFDSGLGGMSGFCVSLLSILTRVPYQIPRRFFCQILSHLRLRLRHHLFADRHSCIWSTKKSLTTISRC